MPKYETIKEKFEGHTNSEKAFEMKKYMRNLFEFYGIATPERKQLYKDFLKCEKKSKTIDWVFLDLCYADEHREFQYLAYDYLLALAPFLVIGDMPKIRTYVLTKSWWDTIDFLCKVIGKLSESDSRVDELMLEWANDENIWIRRTAIEYQLGKKEKTNIENLEKILMANFGTDEFFINKAIGWALREYSKTNPKWVIKFINDNREKMSALSIKEGSKYI